MLLNTSEFSWISELPYTVQITDNMFSLYDALNWLITRGYREEIDWGINMHRELGYSLFYFRDQTLATEFSLIFC